MRCPILQSGSLPTQGEMSGRAPFQKVSVCLHFTGGFSCLGIGPVWLPSLEASPAQLLGLDFYRCASATDPQPFAGPIPRGSSINLAALKGRSDSGKSGAVVRDWPVGKNLHLMRCCVDSGIRYLPIVQGFSGGPEWTRAMKLAMLRHRATRRLDQGYVIVRRSSLRTLLG